MMNTGINQVSAVLGAPYGAFQVPGKAREMMLEAAGEVVELSAHFGVNLNMTDVDEFMKIVATLEPAGKASMLQDVEAGRERELELFAGTVLQMANQFNVPTPVNGKLYQQISNMGK